MEPPLPGTVMLSVPGAKPAVMLASSAWEAVCETRKAAREEGAAERIGRSNRAR